MKRTIAALIVAACAAVPAAAGPFELAVTPSRVEVSGKSGARIGQALTLINIGAAATEVAVRTIDWEFSEDGNVAFFDELREGSCRPWVTLERRFVRVPPQGRVAYRFQIDVAADAPRRECRFMLAIEGVEPSYRAQVQGGAASLVLPVSGRIAVAVYVQVNGAEPRLEVTQLGVSEERGRRLPAITVRNTGDAHGRLDGGLESVDAAGQQLELVPDGSPIMPGQTRTLLLQPRVQQQQGAPELAFPVTSEGQLDWDLGSFKIRTQFR